MRPELEKLFRLDKLPHIWCPGCGHGIIMKQIAEAILESGIDLDKTVIVSGIGCSSRATGYMNFDTIHTTHGRALPFATGIKLANPELNVFVITGDGDCTAIGGNHFIHAARRNLDLNVIMFNNNIYGMTGGQYSPLTPTGDKATTAPYGNVERNFDVLEIAKASGATYVARATAFHTKLLKECILNGMENKGFSFTEALSMCPTSYGRKNKLGDAAEMLLWMKKYSINAKAAAKLPEEKIKDKFIIGELYNNPQAEFTEKYDELVKSLQGEEE